MKRQRGLLLDRLDRNKAHGRARDRLADRLRISGVGLAPLHVWLDVGRRHQPHGMTQTSKLPRPVMARAAGLHADQARSELAEEGHYLSSPQRSSGENLSCSADSVHLEDILGQVDADS